MLKNLRNAAILTTGLSVLTPTEGIAQTSIEADSVQNNVEQLLEQKKYFYADGTEVNLESDDKEKLKGHFSDKSLAYLKDFFENTSDSLGIFSDEEVRSIFGVNKIVENLKEEYGLNVLFNNESDTTINIKKDPYELILLAKSFDKGIRFFPPDFFKDDLEMNSISVYNPSDNNAMSSVGWVSRNLKIPMSHRDDFVQTTLFSSINSFIQYNHPIFGFGGHYSFDAQFDSLKRTPSSNYIKIDMGQIDHDFWVYSSGSDWGNYPYYLKAKSGYYPGEDTLVNKGVFDQFTKNDSHNSPQDHKADISNYYFTSVLMNSLSGDSCDIENIPNEKLLKAIETMKMQWYMIDSRLGPQYFQDLESGLVVEPGYWKTKQAEIYNPEDWPQHSNKYKSNIEDRKERLENDRKYFQHFKIRTLKMHLNLLLYKEKKVDTNRIEYFINVLEGELYARRFDEIFKELCKKRNIFWLSEAYDEAYDDAKEETDRYMKNHYFISNARRRLKELKEK